MIALAELLVGLRMQLSLLVLHPVIIRNLCGSDLPHSMQLLISDFALRSNFLPYGVLHLAFKSRLLLLSQFGILLDLFQFSHLL